jgi:hypothetical protein
VRFGYVVFDGAAFEFDQHHKQGTEGMRALLFLVTDSQGAPVDIVAWSRQENRTATWLNRAWALGEETVFAPRLAEHGALPVWRTPLEWLKAERKGICLLRPRSAAYYLESAGPILAQDAAHGSELRALLTRPAPRILVPSSSRQKAA